VRLRRITLITLFLSRWVVVEMRVPRKFRVKGKEWRTRLDVDKIHHESVLCDGLTLKKCDQVELDGVKQSVPARTILLSKSLSQKERMSVFMHELMHVILFEAHCDVMDEDIEEIVCDAASDVLCELFEIRWKRRRAK